MDWKCRKTILGTLSYYFFIVSIVLLLGLMYFAATAKRETLGGAEAVEVEVDEKPQPGESEEQRSARVKRQISRDQYMRYLQNVNRPDWDPRAEEDWWVLYPYGKWVLDDLLMGQAGRETQANLAFDFPYYGFRYNYTFVYPMGYVSFARPPFIMPPYTFPNPLWPMQRDHGFIAPFYADAQFQWIGNQRVSNVWFRSVHRPQLDDDQFFNPYDPFRSSYEAQDRLPGYPTGGFGTGGNVNRPQYPNPNPVSGFNPTGKKRKKRQMPGRLNQVGMVVDPLLLDNITRDVQDGVNGANGWRAAHAFIVTWERMAYGGAPKAVDVSQFELVKQWQNTFQLVLTTDEVGRSYAIYNYARLNWTSSNEAGGLNGFGGKQAAMAGFNGGNGTGWFPLPYSGHGRIWKLGYFSNVMMPGRWIHRIDEKITPGGCSNGSTGFMVTSPESGPMQGGVAVNVSGPCLRRGDFVKVVFENWPVDCRRINRIRAVCIMPMFHKTGLVPIRMSRDGGQSFPYIGWFYVLQPFRANYKVQLWDSVENPTNRWYQPWAEELTLQWQFLNLTYSMNARVDLNLYGYWEDADRSHFNKIDSIATGIANNGRYTFNPKTLARNPLIADAWKKYHFGFVQVAVSNSDPREYGYLWSMPTPFSWYHLPYWQHQYGNNWATEMCIECRRRLAFDSVLEHAYRGANDDDTFGFNITHPALDYPILGVFRQKGVKKITGNDIIGRIKETKQSRKDLNFDDGMDMEVIRVDREELNKSPKKKQNKEARIDGSGYWANRKLWRGPFKPFYDGYTSDESKSIIKIANTDNLCLFRAVVTAKAHYEHYNLGVLSRKQYRNIQDGNGYGRKQQFHAANQLMERAGLLGFNKTKKSAGIEEIQKIQKAIRKEGFQLKILVHIEKCSKILQRNTIGFDEEIPGVPYLNICNHHNHFDVLVKPSIFFGTMHFCDLCNKGYSEEDHRCPKMCLCCRKRGPCEKGEPKGCSSCNRSFLFQKCYENHLMKAKRSKKK